MHPALSSKSCLYSIGDSFKRLKRLTDLSYFVYISLATTLLSALKVCGFGVRFVGLTPHKPNTKIHFLQQLAYSPTLHQTPKN